MSELMKRCEKALSPTELRYNHIALQKYKDMFPPPEQSFFVEVGGERFMARIDRKFRLRRQSGPFVDLDAIFRVGDKVIIERNDAGIYVLTRVPRGST
jgi:hypothetical protein